MKNFFRDFLLVPLFLAFIITAGVVAKPQSVAASPYTPMPFSNLVKASGNAVYLSDFYAEGAGAGSGSGRYVFPNLGTYMSWYGDFSIVTTITDAQLAALPLKGNVTYRPGKKMVKIDTSPKVYAVAPGGILRWVATEQVAIDLYGADWNKQIDDVPDSFFTNYMIGWEKQLDNNYKEMIIVKKIKIAKY
mgnify:CR=1 FL=1